MFRRSKQRSSAPPQPQKKAAPAPAGCHVQWADQRPGPLRLPFLQLGALLRRVAEPMSMQQELQGLQALAMCLRRKLESEKRKHAATKAALQQEQEMLSILAARLAAVETVAGSTGADLTQTLQELHNEQRLHDITIRSLAMQRKLTEELKQQLEQLEVSTAAGSPRSCSSSSRKAQLAMQVTCLAAGLAAAVVGLPISPVLPPASVVVSAAKPILSGLLAAKTTAAVLRTVGCILHSSSRGTCNQKQQQQQKRRQASTQCAPTICGSTAPGTLRSFNCWEQGDILLLSDSDSLSYSYSCGSTSTSSDSSSKINSSDSELSALPCHPEICDSDEAQSCVSLDSSVECSAIAATPTAVRTKSKANGVLAWVVDKKLAVKVAASSGVAAGGGSGGGGIASASAAAVRHTSCKWGPSADGWSSASTSPCIVAA